MKKILISVGALGVMSFTANQLMNTYQISEALDNVQDMRDNIIYFYSLLCFKKYI